MCLGANMVTDFAKFLVQSVDQETPTPDWPLWFNLALHHVDFGFSVLFTLPHTGKSVVDTGPTLLINSSTRVVDAFHCLEYVSGPGRCRVR